MGTDWGWTVCGQGLRQGGLLVSFQRFRTPPGGRLSGAPPSLGSLPVGLRRAAAQGGAFAVPLATDESLWLGFLNEEAQPVGVRIDLGAATLWGRELSIEPSRLVTLEGVPDPDAGLQALRLDTVKWLQLASRGAAARIELMNYALFRDTTGLPPPGPLNDAAGYSGWRAP